MDSTQIIMPVVILWSHRPWPTRSGELELDESTLTLEKKSTGRVSTEQGRVFLGREQHVLRLGTNLPVAPHHEREVELHFTDEVAEALGDEIPRPRVLGE